MVLTLISAFNFNQENSFQNVIYQKLMFKKMCGLKKGLLQAVNYSRRAVHDFFRHNLFVGNNRILHVGETGTYCNDFID